MIPNSLASNPYMNQYSLAEIKLQGSLRGNQLPAAYNTYTHPITQSIPEYLQHADSSPNRLQEISDLNKRMNQLSGELQLVDSQNAKLKRQLDANMLTIEKLKQLNSDQQEVIDRLSQYREQSGANSEALNQRNLELNNQVQNLLLEREMVNSRASEDDLMRGKEIESLAYRLTEKDHENFELKKRLSGVMEVKMRLENDIASLRFNNENIRNKAELELRERALRLDQNERTMLDTIRTKEDEIRFLMDKIKNLEDESRKQRDNQTLLLTKIADQSRLCPESTIKTSGKENLRDNNESNRLIELLEEKDRKLSDKDAQLSNLANKLKNLELKVEAAETANQSMAKLHEKRGKEETDRESDKSIAPNMMKTIKRLRMSIVDMVFEVYVHSVDVADKKKSNSLVLFITNVEDFLHREGKHLRISIEAYEDTKKAIQHYVNTKATSNQLRNQLLSSIGRFTADEGAVRDKMNKWIEGTVVYTVQQRRLDKSDKNREMLFLFRLLTIKYRIMYPIKGQEIRVDQDLEAILENKVVVAVKHFVVKGVDA